MKTALQIFAIVLLLTICGGLSYLIWHESERTATKNNTTAAPITLSSQVSNYSVDEIIALLLSNYPKTYTSATPEEQARLKVMLQSCRDVLPAVHAFPGYKYQELVVQQQYLGYPENTGQNALVSSSGKIELVLSIGGKGLVSLTDHTGDATQTEKADFRVMDFIYDAATKNCTRDTTSSGYDTLKLVPTTITDQVLQNAEQADAQIASYLNYGFEATPSWQEKDEQIAVHVALFKDQWRTDFAYNLATGAISDKEEPHCTRFDQLSPPCGSYKD